jgi:hypothetical protein
MRSLCVIAYVYIHVRISTLFTHIAYMQFACKFTCFRCMLSDVCCRLLLRILSDLFAGDFSVYYQINVQVSCVYFIIFMCRLLLHMLSDLVAGVLLCINIT